MYGVSLVLDGPHERKEIIVSRNGPYLVVGRIPLEKVLIVRDDKGIPMKWDVGEKYPLQDTYSLCRCGASGDKPYCDGSHLKTDFIGAETAAKEEYIKLAVRLEGPGGHLTDQRGLCARLQFCHRAGGIWVYVEGTGDPETMDLMAEIAGNCAAGRLVAWDKEGRALEPDHELSIGVVEDPGRGVSGPLWVKGGVPIECSDGKKYEVRKRVTLCRCGGSSNKPFCDGAHVVMGFDDGSSEISMSRAKSTRLEK